MSAAGPPSAGNGLDADVSSSRSSYHSTQFKPLFQSPSLRSGFCRFCRNVQNPERSDGLRGTIFQIRSHVLKPRLQPALPGALLQCSLVAVFLVKENTIALAAYRCADAARWVRILGFEKEPVLDGGPLYRGACLDEIASEVLSLIHNSRPAHTIAAGNLTAPLNVERHRGRNRSNRGYRGIGGVCPLAVCQRVSEIVRVGNG